MGRAGHWQRSRGVFAILVAVCLMAAWVLLAGGMTQPNWRAASEVALRRPTGFPQLVSYEPLPVPEGEMCEWVPASSSSSFMAVLRQEELPTSSVTTSSQEPSATTHIDRAPERVIRGPYPLFTGVAVDPVRNEIVVTDENFLNLLVYNRMDNTPPSAAFTEPKRILGGSREDPQDSVLQFPCGVDIDPANGDTYVISNDLSQSVQVFPYGAKGNVSPARKFRIPVETFGLAVDNENEEIFVAVEHVPAVLTYNKWADGYDAPLRILEGRNTGLADPHGIVVDTKNNWMFVANHGSASEGTGKDGTYFTPMPTFVQANGVSGWLIATLDNLADHRRRVLPGSGKFEPPAIKVYPRQASGNIPPLRVMQGPKTQLNWPGHLSLDRERGELYVANDMGDSILVFHATDNGNVAPFRVLQGPKTGLRRPSGVFVDTQNQELVVANMRNHSITVYPLDAAGDTAPLRTIRSGPLGEVAPMILKPSAVAYDSKREEILVPN